MARTRNMKPKRSGQQHLGKTKGDRHRTDSIVRRSSTAVNRSSSAVKSPTPKPKAEVGISISTCGFAEQRWLGYGWSLAELADVC